MPVFDIIFFKALVISRRHAVVRDKETRYHAYEQNEKKKNSDIFAGVAFQFASESFVERIFHFITPLPVEVGRGDLLFVDIRSPYYAVAELEDPVRHVFNGVIVRYHNNSVAVFLIDVLDQFQDIF